MKYIVERASLSCDDNTKPCEGCTLENVLFVDERCASKPEEIVFYKNNPNEWYKEEGYFNHRVENGHIKRDRIDKKWTITFETLEELQAFIEKEGEVIIRKKNYCGYELPEITIYDDWVE